MSVGKVQDPTQVAVGTAPTRELTLPVKSRAPVLGSAFVPVVNVVAETVIRQPAPLPVLSVAVSCWSAGLPSTTALSRPFPVAVQVSDVGEVSDRNPTGSTLTAVTRWPDEPRVHRGVRAVTAA